MYDRHMQETVDTTDKVLVKKGKATELSQKVAEVLSRLRDSRNMSQRDFAESIGVSFQQYQKYEKGRDRLSLEKAILLCSHLGLPLTVFASEAETAVPAGFGESEQQGFGNTSTDLSASLMTADEKELLDLFARIPKKNRQNFLEAVRQLAKMA